MNEENKEVLKNLSEEIALYAEFNIFGILVYPLENKNKYFCHIFCLPVH